MRWSKRVRDSVISSSTGPSNWTTSCAAAAHHEPGAARRAPPAPAGVEHAPARRSCAGASGSSGRPRSAGTGACRGRRPRAPRGPASRSGQRSRAKRGCGVRELVRHVALEHGPDPVRGVVDRVALGHRLSLCDHAVSVSLRGPARKPSSSSASSHVEPTTGSPSTRSSASRLMRPRRTASASAAMAPARGARRSARQDLQALAAALDVEHRLGAGEHDVGAGLRAARRPAASSRSRPAAAPRRRAAPGRWRRARAAGAVVVVALRAQPLDRARAARTARRRGPRRSSRGGRRRASPARRASRRATRSRRGCPRPAPARG